MPAEGFMSGLLGGLAGGAADTMWEQHQQQVEQDLQQRQLQLSFIREAINSPNFKPEFLPVAFASIQEIISAKPGSKKGRGQREAAFGGFTSKITPQVTPDQMREIDPTGRRSRTAQQEREAPGQFPRGFTPMPGVDPMFRTPDETAAEEFRQQRPMLEWRDEQERKKEEARQALEETRIRGRMKVEEARTEARNTGDIRKHAAALEATGVPHDEAIKEAADNYIAGVKERRVKAADDHLKAQAYVTGVQERIKQSGTRLQLAATRVAQGDRRLQIQAKRLDWDTKSRSLMKAIEDAEHSITSNAIAIGKLTKERNDKLLLQPKTPAEIEAVTEIIRDIESRLAGAEQGYNNAQTAAAKARQEADQLADQILQGGSGGGLPQVPAGSRTRRHPDEGKIMVTPDGRRIRVKRVENGQVVDYDELP